ncbi:MAG: ABC transporter ATP-binding protein [Candidatus Eisenbacteria bacterium]|nr:ABC transporter ATP-binding protein [Candidatus Eisenbacteria bacterium]
MLVLHELARAYGDRQALAGVSFTVEPGRIVGLLGANGAGKSTLLRTVAGLQPPDSGTVTVAGHDMWRAPLAAKSALGYAAEDPSFHEELSPREYLAFVASVRGLDSSQASARVVALGDALDLGARLDEPVHGFSHGMRKKLSFMAAVLHRPAVLLCDEALEGRMLGRNEWGAGDDLHSPLERLFLDTLQPSKEVR